MLQKLKIQSLSLQIKTFILQLPNQIQFTNSYPSNWVKIPPNPVPNTTNNSNHSIKSTTKQSQVLQSQSQGPRPNIMHPNPLPWGDTIPLIPAGVGPHPPTANTLTPITMPPMGVTIMLDHPLGVLLVGHWDIPTALFQKLPKLQLRLIMAVPQEPIVMMIKSSISKKKWQKFREIELIFILGDYHWLWP